MVCGEKIVGLGSPNVVRLKKEERRTHQQQTNLIKTSPSYLEHNVYLGMGGGEVNKLTIFGPPNFTDFHALSTLHIVIFKMGSYRFDIQKSAPVLAIKSFVRGNCLLSTSRKICLLWILVAIKGSG